MSGNNLIENELTTSQSSGSSSSRVANFYSGRSVLVTGASGFLGKLLIEKLLRSCTNLRRIFVLIRPRRNKSASERFDELFNSVIFDELRKQFKSQPAGQREDEQDEETVSFNRFLNDKIKLLEGDLIEPLLGLNEEQLGELEREVTVVLHSAAIVSFDGKLRRSIKTNLTGTYNVLQVACKLPRLVSFVHVSTCYSNCTQTEVDEHIYPTNVEPMHLIDLAECFNDDLFELLRERLLNKHPNPYTYSKQLCEHLCGQYAISRGLPVLICRPSIVISTLEEPLAGFVDNRNGGNGLFDGVYRGVLRVAPGSDSALADFVPADTVVNCIIVLGWFSAQYHRARLQCVKSKAEAEPEAEEKVAEGSSLVHGDDDDGTDDDKDDEDDDKVVRLKMIDYYRTRKARLVKKLDPNQPMTEATVAQVKAATSCLPGIQAEGQGKHLGELKDNWKALIEVPVVHVSSGVESPITFSKMFDYIAEGAKMYPSERLFRQPKCTLIPAGFTYKLARFWHQTMVAKLLDLLTVLCYSVGFCNVAPRSAPRGGQLQQQKPQQQQGDKEVWVKEFKRVDRFVGVLTYFLSNSWYFNPETKLKMIKDFMTVEDKRLFNCHSVSLINWRKFAHQIALGMRKYISNESDETLEMARVKYKRTYWRNTTLQAIMLATLGFLAHYCYLMSSTS